MIKSPDDEYMEELEQKNSKLEKQIHTLEMTLAETEALEIAHGERVEKLMAQVTELEKELGDFESDIDTCTQHNVELQLEVTKLTAERDELNNIAENIGDLHHVTLDEWAAMKAERDALKQQIDDLLSAAKYAMQQIGGMQPTKPLVDAFYALKDAADSVEAIASINENENEIHRTSG